MEGEGAASSSAAGCWCAGVVGCAAEHTLGLCERTTSCVARGLVTRITRCRRGKCACVDLAARVDIVLISFRARCAHTLVCGLGSVNRPPCAAETGGGCTLAARLAGGFSAASSDVVLISCRARCAHALVGVFCCVVDLAGSAPTIVVLVGAANLARVLCTANISVNRCITSGTRTLGVCICCIVGPVRSTKATCRNTVAARL